MKKILIISFTNLNTDARPNRQIKLLKNSYEVHTAGLKSSKYKDIKFFPIKKLSIPQTLIRLTLLKLRIYEKYYWDALKINFVNFLSYNNYKYDLLIVHEVRVLPLALKIAKGAKIILDAHEYSPENYSDQFLWKFFFKKYFNYLCTKYLRKCDSIITISDRIAEEYNKNFGVRTKVITNASDYVELEPSKVNKESIKLIHHGLTSPSRKLELTIKMMDYLRGKYILDLMLVYSRFNKIYYNKLKRIARDKNNVKFIAPVAFNKLVNFTNRYDIGVFLLPPTNFNLKYALPNKFFEFIQARLAIAIGPSPEMAKIVRQYNLGVVADDFSAKAMSKAISSLTYEQIMNFKKQSHKYAKKLSSIDNENKIKGIISRLID